MKGWLIYDEEGAVRNEWFIAECLRYARGCGLDLRLQVVRGGACPDGELPDFALVRTIAPALSERLEKRGVRVFNNAEVSAVANDKWCTHQRALALDLPVMSTLISSVCKDGSPFGYPVVVKRRDGHGGSEVYKADTEKAYRALWQGRKPADYVTQAICSELGKDMRVYLLGGEILGAVFRTSDTDFRSNFSLGGKVECVPVPHEIEKMVQIFHKSLQTDFVGIDFIRHRGEWVLNEVEDVVGSRMLYKTAGLDVAKAYIEHVAKTMEKTPERGQENG